MDTNKPYVGYRSPRRSERNNNREAAKNAPLAVLRGWAAGTAGLPGDIEGLIRLLPGIKDETPVLPTSDFYKEWLPLKGETPLERALTEAGSLTGGAGVGAAARAAKTGVSAGARGALNAVQAAARNAQMPRTLHPQAGVIKMKGGNWLDGSVEDAVKPLKYTSRGRTRSPEELLADMRAKFTPEVMETLTPASRAHTEKAFADTERKVAINQWLDKKLARYIKNEMATPEDPVRALAERGVLHVDPANLSHSTEGLGVRGLRLMAEDLGVPAKASGFSQAAKAWDKAADSYIGAPNAGKYGPEYAADSDYDPGFSHLVDELRNATNPESGLPRELLWKYADLDKVTVPQAVERVAKINDWRAAQKAEADLLRANNAATVLHKEYPEGYRWVELKAPDRFAEGETQDKWGDLGRYATAKLKDALKYEGDTMGHCVGGYCDDVLAGRTRIYSLRDKKGQPHTTIEVAPSRKLTENDLPDDVRDMLADTYGDASREEFEAAVARAVQERQTGDRIVQIKGKQNRAPNPEYLPYVQDFVKSGKWSDVGDLGNTGLVEYSKKRQTIPKGLTGTIPKFDEAGIPEGFYSEGELVELMRGWQNKSGNTPGYAAGGLVTYNPAEIDDRVSQLLAELESEGV